MFTGNMAKRLSKGYFSLEGNIGAGKSTFLQYLAGTGLAEQLELVEQPVESWKQIGPGKTNLLDLYYKQPVKWALPFQLTVLFSRMERLSSRKGKKTLLMERSIEADYFVFGKLMNQNNTKQQQDIYFHLYRIISEQTTQPHQGLIYFNISEADCLSRIRARGRPEEKSITIEYLSRIRALHEDWMKDKRVFVVQNFDLQGDNTQLLNQLKKFMNLT